MRILLIHNFYNITGGEDVYVKNLYNLLLKKGHTVSVFKKENNQIAHSQIAKIKVAQKLLHPKSIAIELEKKLTSFKPDIAHINNLYPQLTPIIRETLYKNTVPTVETIHTYRPLCPKGNLFRNNSVCEACVKKIFQYPAIQYGCYHDSKIASTFLVANTLLYQPNKQLQKIDKLIFPSEYMANYFHKQIQLKDKQTEVLPHFVEEKKVSERFHDDNLPSHFYLFVGRLFEEKGILPLLETVAKVPHINLVVIGTGPLYQEVLAYNKLPHIFIKGEVSNNKLPYYYSKASATIIPSLGIYEVGPLVLLESYAYGTPVITTDFELFKERVIPSKTGFLFAQNDFSELQDILENQNTLNELSAMKKNIPSVFLNSYSKDAYYQKLLKIYNTLMYEAS